MQRRRRGGRKRRDKEQRTEEERVDRAKGKRDCTTSCSTAEGRARGDSRWRTASERERESSSHCCCRSNANTVPCPCNHPSSLRSLSLSPDPRSPRSSAPVCQWQRERRRAPSLPMTQTILFPERNKLAVKVGNCFANITRSPHALLAGAAAATAAAA